MSNIPGAPGALPGVYDIEETLSSGVSIPGGLRVAAIIGQGAFSEVLVAAALGGGKDGLNPTYTSTTGADGRHFALSNAPVISNRTQLFRNGLPLLGLEEAIDSNPFSFVFDYRIDITNGHIELQRAHLVNQGGAFYIPSSTNVGIGVINGLTLEDSDAPSETWTIKCVSVQRNSLNQPISGTAKFTAFGSVSGNLLDANGNIVYWIANNIAISNNILSFAIQETTVTPFREGDTFTIKVSSGVLNKNDTLTVTYIPVINLNVPTFYQSMKDISTNFGNASLDNNITLGCQLAFANGAPGIMCVQAAPPLPRRTSYILSDNVEAASTNPNDFIFALPVGVVPDTNSAIHFFVTDPSTKVETQLLPNKLPFYTLNLAGQPTTSQFIFSDVQAPAGWDFFYTVLEQSESVVSGLDGYITENITDGYTFGVFESPSVVFDSSYVGLTLQVIDANNVANIGSFTIDSVSGGFLFVHTSGFTPFTSGSGINFETLDASGNIIGGGTGTDGVLDTAGHLNSGTVDFSTISGIDGYYVKISGTTTNNGLYPVVAHASHQVTIRKSIVTESNLRYEVIDSGATSPYIVVNHNVVPDGNELRVTIVDARDASFFDAGWLNALASLETVECDIVVPLPNQTISVIFQNTLNHCLTMSNILNKKERLLFIGAINGLTPDNVIGAKLAAVENIGLLEGIQGNTVAEILSGNTEDLANYSVPAAYGETYRAVYFYPDQIVVQAGGDNILIDGFYLAAAGAGFFSGTGNIAMPLTNKVLSGFTILRNRQFSPFTLSQLANAGITVLQPVSGGGTVIWGITTSQSGFVEEQEISIVFIRDRIAKDLRSGFGAFIGMPDDGTMIPKLSARANSLLTSFIDQNLITAYKDLAIVRDAVDPTQFDITVRVAPIYPVNFVFIKVSIGLL